MPNDAPPPSPPPSPTEEAYDALCAVLFWHRLEVRRGRPGLPGDLAAAIQAACDQIAQSGGGDAGAGWFRGTGRD